MKIDERLETAHDLIEQIYRRIFPKYGFSVREGQIEMTHWMLDCLVNQRIAAINAEVGTGKTYAYLIALTIYRKYFSNERFVTADPKVPLISTTSIQLQNALMQEYIPKLSGILLREGIIQKPLKAVLRTGKRHYVCDARLAIRLEQTKQSTRNAENQQALKALKKQIHLDSIPALTVYDRERVCVPEKCLKNCPKRKECRYRAMIAELKEQDFDFQICNHNLFLADAMHRYEGQGSLLHNAEIVVVDEAHDLPEAARAVHTKYFTPSDCIQLAEIADRWNYPRISAKVLGLSQYLWKKLDKAGNTEIPDFLFSGAAQLADLANQIMFPPSLEAEREEAFTENFSRMLTALVMGEYAVEIQRGEGGTELCLTPIQVSNLLYTQLWKMKKSAILTSGTLALDGSFGWAKQSMGIARTEQPETLMVKAPFNYQKNCLLYLPDDLPRIEEDNALAVRELSDRILRIISATYGHTLVLFTSYKLQEQVYGQIKSKTEFPIFVARKHPKNAAFFYGCCE